MGLLNQESSLLEIVKLIGSDVLPDDQKLILEIARVIRLGFLQQNAFHKDDTCVSMEKQFLMMDTILYLSLIHIWYCDGCYVWNSTAFDFI